MKKYINETLQKSKDNRILVRLSKTIVLKSAKEIGDTREIWQLGFAIVNMESRIRFICINRRVVQIRID
ncbi:hypothetical protein DRF65_16105 [Chryseobacterium pennae]|uniref:Uncharacterized protein n=1 Tax=Chryseobacterium pennae TaxID=2258962 RepID=A0A3D9C6U4_9FLAO|nr:hypothetical protein DRF65_16105 [Chryseobacterium pennae]